MGGEVGSEGRLEAITRTNSRVSLKFGAGGHLDLTGGHPSARPFGPSRGVRGHAPPEIFEIPQLQRCIFLHFEAQTNIQKLPSL